MRLRANALNQQTLAIMGALPGSHPCAQFQKQEMPVPPSGFFGTTSLVGAMGILCKCTGHIFIPFNVCYNFVSHFGSPFLEIVNLFYNRREMTVFMRTRRNTKFTSRCRCWG